MLPSVAKLSFCFLSLFFLTCHRLLNGVLVRVGSCGFVIISLFSREGVCVGFV